MINRTYVVKPPTGASPFVDICVASPTGSQVLPVCNPAFYAAANTPPPAGWAAVNGDAAYYEIRSRVVRLEHLASAGAAGGFAPRCRLGYTLSIYPVAGYDVFQMPSVILSASLYGTLGGDANIPVPAIPLNQLADPAYGPVIRIYGPDRQSIAAEAVYMVHFSIFERKDEDFSPVGGV